VLEHFAEALRLLESGEEVMEAARTRRMRERVQAGDAEGAVGVLGAVLGAVPGGAPPSS
jgi:hypothetical protein